MHFETFDRHTAARAARPWITIQKQGVITINAAAYALLNQPAVVCPSIEGGIDGDCAVLALRAPAGEDPLEPAALRVRLSGRSASGPWAISAVRFLRAWGIDTTVARRRTAVLTTDALTVRLDDPGVIVSRADAPLLGAY